MDDYIWLFSRKEYGEFSASVLSSVLFHALVFAILASTTVFQPLPGDSDKIDILWYYPLLSPGNRTADNEKPASPRVRENQFIPVQVAAAAQPRGNAGEQRVTEAGATARKTLAEHLVPPPTPPAPPESEATIPPLIAAPPDEDPEPEREPEMTIPAAIEPPEKKPAPIAEKPAAKPAAPQGAGKESIPKAAPQEEKRNEPLPAVNREAQAKEAGAPSAPVVKETVRPAAEKAVAAPAALITGPNPQPAAVRPDIVASVRIAPSMETKSTVVSSPAAAMTTRSPAKEGEARNPALKSPATARAKGSAGDKSDTAAIREAASAPAARTPSAAKAPPAVKAPGEAHPASAGTKGIYLPIIKGDLKLEIIGTEELLQRIKVVALFHEFSRTRRNRPLTRGEWRQVRTLTPILVRSGARARQAVIEVAGDGIYDFRVESDTGQPVEAEYSVKLYDNGGKARIKPLGHRSISQSESIVKVLMPEGILWDEDTAFSGSIEDSEGVTKFNSDTGLTWKEYK